MASPIRLTGMNSGLDTESIIQALTSTQKTKVSTLEGNQKRLTWKQDAWKTLNKKITDFYNGTLSSMRFTDAFTKKTTVSSNSGIATITTSADAMNTTQELEVKNLATTANQTSLKLTKSGASGGGNVTSDTKISELSTFSQNQESAGGTYNIRIKVGGQEKEFSYSGDDTIGDLVKKFKDQGINANFDEGQGRFYLSAKDTGADAGFQIVSAKEGASGLYALGLRTSQHPDALYNEGKDANIVLNGVEYSSKDGNFNINGLTITANAEGKTTLTTKNDTSGIYNMVKDFIKGYSELINEMSKLYNADSAKSYKMLTSEEKDAMSEDEIEDWENKIKEGLLSKDSTLGDASNAMRSIMASTFEVKNGNGETVKMSLSSFGINTQSYFNASKDERNAYHIDGDKDSEISSVKSAEDKLSQWITNDPDAVTNFFTTLAKSLYSKMTDLMKGTEYSSSYTLYEDKLMNKQYSSYNDKISDANEKLTAMEDRYYKKFSKMETAMAKLNSTQSSISSYFGLG